MIWLVFITVIVAACLILKDLDLCIREVRELHDKLDKLTKNKE